LRYWHLGESLNFNPSLLGINFSGSQNFVDPLVGGRVEAFLSPRITVNILGDVGGWGTGSQLEYQWAGMLGYKVKPKWTLEAGYRYLYIDKPSSRGVIFNATTAGVIFGITFNLK
jgi:opacity protein-like surface antigen